MSSALTPVVPRVLTLGIPGQTTVGLGFGLDPFGTFPFGSVTASSETSLTLVPIYPATNVAVYPSLSVYPAATGLYPSPGGGLTLSPATPRTL